MRASTSDYSRPQKGKDCVVKSYDGYTSYLLIVDEAIRYAWVFLMASKDPLLDIVREFLHLHGHEEGGSIRTHQGGKLARSLEFQDLVLWTFHYTLEPTGAGSPSQNGAVKNYNDKFAVRTRTLLFWIFGRRVRICTSRMNSYSIRQRVRHGYPKPIKVIWYCPIANDLADLQHIDFCPEAVITLENNRYADTH